MAILSRPAITCCCSSVSVLTTIRACFHRGQNLLAKTQKALSKTVSVILGRLRFIAASSWRKARFSIRRPRRARKWRRLVANKSPKISVVWSCYRSVLVERNRHPVEITAGQSSGEAHYTKPKSHNWCRQTGSPIPVIGRAYPPVTVRRILPWVHRLSLSGLISRLTKECSNTAAPRIASAHSALHM